MTVIHRLIRALGMGKGPAIISKSTTSLEKMTSLRAMLGRRVFSATGQFVGRVSDVHLLDGSFKGVAVSGREEVFIGKEYLEADAVETVILTIDPVTLLVGKIVFDEEGRRLGRVKGIQRSSLKNECDAIIVRNNVFAKPRTIPFSEIEVSKKNIILNKAHKEGKE